jgi:hypothetical protein
LLLHSDQSNITTSKTTNKKEEPFKKGEPSVLKTCSRVQDKVRTHSPAVATQFNSPFSKFNNFCNTDQNKIAKKPKEQTLQVGSKVLT